VPDLPDLRTDGRRTRPDGQRTDPPVEPGGAVADRGSELAAEQARVDAAYAALDEMRRSAERVSEAYAEVRRGGTHQARLERDIAHDTTRRRLAALDIGGTPLVFGRIDRDDGERFYIGRIAVDDEDHDPLVVDWSAPVAEPFYRATAVEPMGVVRRRHFADAGRARDRGSRRRGLRPRPGDGGGPRRGGGGSAVRGPGAPAHGPDGRHRRHDPGRAGPRHPGRPGGDVGRHRRPGTGKTAVALHRAAYLLYTHRDRLRSQGVLLVGPGGFFLRYIEQVLPSLGEHDVQLATLAGLKPRLTLTGTSPRPWRW